nr:Flp1 family type IVb pilin [uncultured Mediterraneibacter sp.]
MENFLIQHRYVSGVTVIELVLILVIIIALLVIFKDNLVELITDIFEKITSESANF